MIYSLAIVGTMNPANPATAFPDILNNLCSWFGNAITGIAAFQVGLLMCVKLRKPGDFLPCLFRFPFAYVLFFSSLCSFSSILFPLLIVPIATSSCSK